MPGGLRFCQQALGTNTGPPNIFYGRRKTFFASFFALSSSHGVVESLLPWRRDLSDLNESMGGCLLDPLHGRVGRWSMKRWPLVDSRVWMLSARRWVVVEPLHGCIERWSVERWSLLDARLLGDVLFLNLRRKPALV